MKKKLLKKLLQVPLRFHHQDIHEELGRLRSDVDACADKLDEIIRLLKESNSQ
jgi:hypothetical protein